MRGERTGRQVAQVHELSAPRAVHALVAEGPQRSLEAHLVVAGDAHAREAQALTHLGFILTFPPIILTFKQLQWATTLTMSTRPVSPN